MTGKLPFAGFASTLVFIGLMCSMAPPAKADVWVKNHYIGVVCNGSTTDTYMTSRYVVENGVRREKTDAEIVSWASATCGGAGTFSFFGSNDPITKALRQSQEKAAAGKKK